MPSGARKWLARIKQRDGKLREIVDWIGDYRGLWQDNLNRLKSYLEEK